MDASNNNVLILMNQTTLTREECEKQLKDNNNNVFDCLMEYYKVNKQSKHIKHKHIHNNIHLSLLFRLYSLLFRLFQL